MHCKIPAERKIRKLNNTGTEVLEAMIYEPLAQMCPTVYRLQGKSPKNEVDHLIITS